jgi:hypothetical protein
LLLVLLLLQSISPGKKQASQELQAIVQLLLLWGLHTTQQMSCLLKPIAVEKESKVD